MTNWLKQHVRQLIGIVFIGLMALFVWRNWPHLADSITVMRSVTLGDFWAAVPFVLLTFVLAAFSYGFLAFRKLRFRELFAVELAAAFVNRVVPSGLGGLGIHGDYLHKRRHTIAQATAVVSINNLIGATMHCLVLALVLAIGVRREFHFIGHISQGWVLLGLGLIAVALIAVPHIRDMLGRFLHNLFTSFARYRHEPHRLVYAALSLLALTLANLLILHLAARSFGVWFDAPTLFVIYSAGVLLGAVVPTPGGLAGVEAGLAGGLVAYGVEADIAVAITLAFRLVTYWLPLLPSAVALVYCRKAKLI